MFETIVYTVRSAGAFAYLAIMGGGLGVVLAIATGVVAAKKTSAGKVLGVLCLFCALGVLGVGAAGYAIGMSATLRAVPNVPDEMKDLLLRKGTEESRLNFLIALAASALPLATGLLALFMARARAGIAFAVLVAGAWAAMLVQLKQPLPPGEPPVVEVAGLKLPRSVSSHGVAGAALIALTPDGLWADGSKVATIADALAAPRVRERNTSVVPLLVDERVRFAALADVLEGSGRDKFQLVLASADGTHSAITIRHEKGAPVADGERPALALTLSIGEQQLEIGAVGGALPAIPGHDWAALNDKLAEIKTSFPDNATLRVTAAPDVTVEVLVQALAAASERNHRVLIDDFVVGRFTLPRPAQP